MKETYDNFIGIYRDVYPKEYCSHMISEAERLFKAGAGTTRQQAENGLSTLKKADTHLHLNCNGPSIAPFNDANSNTVFFNGVQECYERYVSEFPAAQEAGNLVGTCMKLQKISSGEGYHIWHSEQGAGETGSRALVYMLYLNTLPTDAAGETEFLYQQKRVPPVENTLVIWPASFTHTHRGNTVFGDRPKYIITGWFQYN